MPCGPINPLSRVFADPQVIARGMQLDLTRPDGSAAPGVANPVKASRTPPQVTRPAPLLGADTDTVLTDILKLDRATIGRLRAAGIVG